MKPTRMLHLISAAVLMLSAACTSEPESADLAAPVSAAAPAGASTGASDGSPYAFDAPTASIPLAQELTEISALTVLDENRLAAVQDEHGIVYILNAASGAIERQIPFADGGDYEGIELAGDRLFVLRSNGTVEEILGWESGEARVQSYKTHLKGKNDTEGLAYDRANNRLLIVTKEDGGEGMNKDTKAVYAFDLTTNAMAAAPVFTLDLNAFKERITGDGKFKPSALAVHPETGDVYVLSSVAKAIVVLDRSGTLKSVWNLPESIYEQPEGLAFLRDGGLLISSEGVERPGMLHRISPVRNP